jgi:large subunit ribosomal protein L15
MRLDELSSVPGATHKRKRVARGYGSGHGACSGRGNKGQKSRAGNRKMRPGFEGGQLPIIKRLPSKRGFTNIFKTMYSIVDIGELNVFESGSEVTPEKLLEAGVIESLQYPIKILADGEVEHPLTVKANKFSASAKAKIEAAGGKAEEISAGEAK